MRELEPKDRIIVALDVDSIDKAIFLVDELRDNVGCFKIGLQFINAMLVSIIASRAKDEAIKNLTKIRKLFRLLGGNIFWDGKLDDIPNTIAGASIEINKISVKMFNLHASAGDEAIKKAVANKGNALCLGVTVLTSIDEVECVSIFGEGPQSKVLYFAAKLVDAKADGIICSPQELAPLSANEELDPLVKVIPGIRPKWAATGDQKRITTPADAVKSGADYLVIGRPITKPPVEIGSSRIAAELIADEIAKALKGGGK